MGSRNAEQQSTKSPPLIMPTTRPSSRLAAITLSVTVLLLFAGCQLLSEKPEVPPATPREKQEMAPEENAAAIRKLEKQLEKEKGERVTGELMNLVLLIYCYQ